MAVRASSITSDSYVFPFPKAKVFMQSLQELNPVGKHISLAWEMSSPGNPKYFVMQAVMAKHETCLTHRYPASWVLGHEPFFEPLPYDPLCEIKRLQLKPSRPRILFPISNPFEAKKQEEINGRRELKGAQQQMAPSQAATATATYLCEICTVNIDNLYEKLRERYSVKMQEKLSFRLEVDLDQKVLRVQGIPLDKDKGEIQDKLAFADEIARIWSANETETKQQESVFGEFLKRPSRSLGAGRDLLPPKMRSRLLLAETKLTPVTEVLVDRELWLPILIFPYCLSDWEASAAIETKKSPAINSSQWCAFCETLKEKNIDLLKWDNLRRWRLRYEEDTKEEQEVTATATKPKLTLDPSYPFSPFHSSILNCIEHVQLELQSLLFPSQEAFPELDRICPFIKAAKEAPEGLEQASLLTFDCEFLLPSLQQFCRDLKMTSPIATFVFSPEQFVLVADGEVAYTSFQCPVSDETTTLIDKNKSILDFYRNYKCPQSFHIDLPLRQLSLFSKLTTTQKQYLNPHYVKFKFRSNCDYVELFAASKAKQREVIQLLFPCHKLQQAGFMNFSSSADADDSSPETP